MWSEAFATLHLLIKWQYLIQSLVIHTSILQAMKWNSWFTILYSLLLALILMYWIWVVRLFSCVNILSQIVHCIYHNVHFVWIVGENEICLSAPILWQDKQFFEYIHPSSGILYEYEQWIWLFFILYFYSIVFDLFWFYQFFSQFRHAEGFSQFRHYKLRFYWRSLKQLWYH